eukprot:511549-Pelagomonas_calceolata.AAC.2
MELLPPWGWDEASEVSQEQKASIRTTECQPVGWSFSLLGPAALSTHHLPSDVNVTGAAIASFQLFR